MANFCEACGSQLTGVETFCWKCGAAVRHVSSQAAGAPQPQQPVVPQQPVAGYQQVQLPQPSSASYPPPPQQPPNVQFQQVSTPANPAYAQVPASGGLSAPSIPPVAKKSSPWVAIVAVVLALFFVGGVAVIGGVWYVAHRVNQKVHQLSAAAGASEVTPSNALATLTHTDSCRLLSKEEVGTSLGVEIVATKTIDDGCEYLAKGTTADMTAKHMAALSGAQGADSKQQELIHKFAGGVFAAQSSHSQDAGSDENGNTPVLVFTVDKNGAEAQMKATSGVMGMLGPGQKHIEGIGDDALDESGAMMLVRKGDKLIRITYTSCPCGTDAVKPLAKKLADAV